MSQEEWRPIPGWNYSARSHISRHPDLAGNLQEISDHYYKEYMNG